MEPKYKVGQVVTHKASGELAVVEQAIYSCRTHPGPGLYIAHMSGDGCEWEFDDRYRISLGFDRDSIEVDDILIEAED